MSGGGLPFLKGQALGNDYFVVDVADLDFTFTAEHGRRLCDRHRGAGSDGVLLADLRDGRFTLRIMNPDGTPAEKSGNGLRIFGAYLHGRGLVGDAWFGVHLVKDVVRMRIEEELGGGALQIRAEMGRATFRGEDVGFRTEGEVLGEPLALPGGATADVNTVSLANPHCVVFVERLDRDDFLARAPLLCTHDAFAEGTNVQLARVVGPNTLEAWIWERGAGETLASGSSACAVTAAAVRRGFIQPGTHTVRMQGGEAEVEVSESYEVKLRGPAQIVYSGHVREEVLAEWVQD